MPYQLTCNEGTLAVASQHTQRQRGWGDISVAAASSPVSIAHSQLGGLGAGGVQEMCRDGQGFCDFNLFILRVLEGLRGGVRALQYPHSIKRAC